MEESISFRNVALPGCEFSSDAPEIVSVSTAGAITAAAPVQSPDASVPTNKPGNDDPKVTPAATKAPSKADTGKTNTTAKGKTVVYKKAKYRITGAATVEFTQLVKGKTVTIPDTITVGGKVYKVTSIAAGA